MWWSANNQTTKRWFMLHNTSVYCCLWQYVPRLFMLPISAGIAPRKSLLYMTRETEEKTVAMTIKMSEGHSTERSIGFFIYQLAQREAFPRYSIPSHIVDRLTNVDERRDSSRDNPIEQICAHIQNLCEGTKQSQRKARTICECLWPGVGSRSTAAKNHDTY